MVDLCGDGYFGSHRSYYKYKMLQMFNIQPCCHLDAGAFHLNGSAMFASMLDMPQ